MLPVKMDKLKAEAIDPAAYFTRRLLIRLILHGGRKIKVIKELIYPAAG